MASRLSRLPRWSRRGNRLNECFVVHSTHPRSQAIKTELICLIYAVGILHMDTTAQPLRLTILILYLVWTRFGFNATEHDLDEWKGINTPQFTDSRGSAFVNTGTILSPKKHEGTRSHPRATYLPTSLTRGPTSPSYAPTKFLQARIRRLVSDSWNVS